MNHSQKLELIEDEIRALIKERKIEGFGDTEIKKDIEKQFKVSTRTAQRYFNTFNQVEIGKMEVPSNKKEINIIGSRLLRDELINATLIEDDKERVERIGLIIKTSNAIKGNC